MPIAIFASKTFKTSSRSLYTFDEFTTSSGLQVEKQDVEGKKPSTYIKGSDLDSMSFNIPLSHSLGIDVWGEFVSWKAIMEREKAYTFILGGKPVGQNKWLLKSVQLSNSKIDGNGKILSASLQLQFEEYVRAGTKSKSTNTGQGTSIVDQLTEPEKAEEKRDNPNANLAMLNRVDKPVKTNLAMLNKLNRI